MENPTHFAPPTRRSVRVTKARQQAQVDNHKVFIAAIAAAAKAASSTADYYTTSVPEADELIANTLVGTNTTAAGGEIVRAATTRRGTFTDGSTTARAAVSHRGSRGTMNDIQTKTGSADGASLSMSKSGSSFHIAQRIRRSIVATEMYPFNDSLSGHTSTMSSVLHRSVNLDYGQLKEDSLKVEESRMSLYMQLKD